MNKRIIALVASLAVIIGLMSSGSSYAWFVNSVVKNQSITVSLVSSVHSGSLATLDSPEGTVIMQGDNLVSLDGKDAVLQVENKSTIDTQIRISVEYTSYKNGAAEQVIYSASDEDDIIVTFAEGKWSKNVNAGGVCYFYYMGNNFASESIDNLDTVPSINASTSSVQAISSIVYKDDISYAYSGQKINIKVTFESKQADNVTWSTVDSYDVAGTGK